MSSINDFATTYMCQSLPFGGVKQSGFDRFAGEALFFLSNRRKEGGNDLKPEHHRHPATQPRSQELRDYGVCVSPSPSPRTLSHGS
jgi:hypothetical protein